MTEHEVLQQRMTTLQSLLESPGGPFGAKGAPGAPLAQQLAERWRTELKLIARILDDCPSGQDLQQTLDLWCDRTAAFLATSKSDRPGWTDRQGQAWDAGEVLELIEDLKDRLKAWRPKPAEGLSDSTKRQAAGPLVGPGQVRLAADAPGPVEPGRPASTGESFQA
jgi:hypothetical protein